MKMHRLIPVLSVASLACGAIITDACADEISVGPAAVQPQAWGAAAAVTFAYDDATVKPMPLPKLAKAPVLSKIKSINQLSGPAGFSPGNTGTGVQTPVDLGASNVSAQDFASSAEVSPQEYGTALHPFTTSRVDIANTNWVSSHYPFSATGKLYFKQGAASYVCSASLVKKGIILTAAHCVSAFGGAYYTNFQYVPARYGTKAPFGVWNAGTPRTVAAYHNGTDSCAAAGVVCKNDVAVLTVVAQGGVYPGTATGWYGYNYGGFGFTSNGDAIINQLGYPVSHDGGLRMQRTDSIGFISSTMSNNTIWGSRQTGGSSGGPELVNLGDKAVVLGGGVTKGSEATPNTVVGVTSWGYNDQKIKQQGASPFLSTNVHALVTAACKATPAACQP